MHCYHPHFSVREKERQGEVTSVPEGHAASKWLNRYSNQVIICLTAELLSTKICISRAYLLCDAFLQPTVLQDPLLLQTMKHMGSATLVVHITLGY